MYTNINKKSTSWRLFCLWYIEYYFKKIKLRYYFSSRVSIQIPMPHRARGCCTHYLDKQARDFPQLIESMH